MFDRTWLGCSLCYGAGLSWVYTESLDIGWQFLIALVIFMVGNAIADGAAK